ncbi:MAG: hypothetical protein WCV67_04555 [Victivallaceae bacterium]|jgi:hypothetical protein
MTDTDQSRRKKSFLIAAALFIAVLYFTRDGIFRPLWFDEALTIMNFMALPGPVEIYYNYVIPNNHIVYTVLLKLWSCIYQPVVAFDVYLRLFSLVITLAAFGIMFCRWKKQCGILAVALVCACFAFSLPFGIYSVAVRGYMLSFLLVVLALEFARRWISGPNWKNGAAYFVISLLAVGTIPSNIIALGAVVLCFAEFPLKNRKFIARFLFLAIIPLIALAIFYFPVSKGVARVMALREGWNNGFAAMTALYLSWAVSFLPVIPAAILAVPLILRRKNSWRGALITVLVLLLPVPFFLIISPAPFPRVFFSVWPVWMYFLCRGLGHLFALLRLKKFRITLKLLPVVLAAAVVACGMAQQEFKEYLSAKYVGGQALDDFFSPYYMKDSFNPFDAVKSLQVQGATEGTAKIYVSFNADPYSIVFYGKMLGVSPDVWCFDNPRGKVLSLENNCRRAILAGGGDENAFTGRFKGKVLERASPGNNFQRVYSVSDDNSVKP